MERARAVQCQPAVHSVTICLCCARDTRHVTRGPLRVDNMMVTRLTQAWCPVLSLVVICIGTVGYCSQVRRYVHMPISVYKQNMFLKIFENNLSIQNIIHKNLVPRHRLNL